MATTNLSFSGITAPSTTHWAASVGESYPTPAGVDQAYYGSEISSGNYSLLASMGYSYTDYTQYAYTIISFRMPTGITLVGMGYSMYISGTDGSGYDGATLLVWNGTTWVELTSVYSASPTLVAATILNSYEDDGWVTFAIRNRVENFHGASARVTVSQPTLLVEYTDGSEPPTPSSIVLNGVTLNGVTIC